MQAGGGAPAEAAPIVQEKKEEPKEESDDNMGFSLFEKNNRFEEMLQKPKEVAMKRKRTRETLQVLQRPYWVVDIARNDLEADTLSYHYNLPRHLPFDTIDPSLAIGFYCRDKVCFKDFCAQAFELAHKSKGANLVTIVWSLPKPVHHDNVLPVDRLGAVGRIGQDADALDMDKFSIEANLHEDEWKLL